jgi:hypothetical protein
MILSDLSIHRLFNPEPNARRDLLEGLDLSGFLKFSTARRGVDGPFSGPAVENLNSSEAFFQDAVRSIRRKALVIPNPFGGADIATRDVLVSPSDPWKSVPVFAFRFAHTETFYFLKRGHAWCHDLGLFFPSRRMLVSFQQEERHIARDCIDIQYAFQFFSDHRDEVFSSLLRTNPSTTPCMIVNSDHFAHHIWNELSVIDGLIAEGVHKEVLLLVNRRPLASLSELFPEIPKNLIVDMAGPLDEPFLFAMQQSLFVAPTGRRFIPRRLTDRILDCARARFPEEGSRAAAFRANHELVLWITVRVDARTATNLIEALAASISALLGQYPRMGVVFDGFTLPSSETLGWNQNLTDREIRTVSEIVSLVGTPFDHTVLSGKYTMEAFVWAQTADYYICPYGTAQHKISWINPVPGLVHVGENKRSVAAFDAAYHALQRGATPSFFYGTVTRTDSVANERRKDLFSYDLDVDAFAARVEAEVLGLVG